VGPRNEDDEPRGFLDEAFEHWQRRSDDAEEADVDVPAGAGAASPGVVPEPGAPGGSGVDVEALVGSAEPEPPPPELSDDERALVDEAMKKSGLIWVAGSGRAPQAVWYVWADGAAYVLTGGAEQPDPGLADAHTVRVVARSKDTRTRLIEWPGLISRLQPTDAQWDEIAGALAKARLNLSDPASAPARWAADPAMAVYRIAPIGGLIEQPGRYADDSRRAKPVPTSAATAGPPPKVIHRRQTTRRPLS
jgi:hypothetical protein